jgi:CRP/FNR family transcriptional activator FtrB
MRSDEIDQVKGMALFAGCDAQRIETLLRASFLQRFPAQVELVHESERPDFLHVVVEGQVEVFARYRERETTVAILERNQMFILAAVMTDKPYLKSARTLSPSRILMMPAEMVRALFDAEPAFAKAIAVELALAYRDAVKELKNQKLRSNLERLANWVIRTEREQGGYGFLELNFDKRVLASRLGMAPEVLSRSFAALAAYDVAVNGRRIVIGDREALTHLARPDPLIDDPEL